MIGQVLDNQNIIYDFRAELHGTETGSRSEVSV